MTQRVFLNGCWPISPSFALGHTHFIYCPVGNEAGVLHSSHKCKCPRGKVQCLSVWHSRGKVLGKDWVGQKHCSCFSIISHGETQTNILTNLIHRQHTRPPSPSPTPRVYPNSCPLISDTIQPSHPLSSLFLLPSIFPSIRVYSNESVLRIRWPKYWSFSFSISPSNKHSGLISFRMDWLDLLAVQGTLKSLL